jgi:hypothetical protein
VLALLALACFPVLAQAEESSGTVYETAVPGPTGNKSPDKSNPGAQASKGGGATAPGSTNPGNPGSESSDESSAGTNPSTGGGTGNGQGSPGKGSTAGEGQGGGQQGLSNGQPVNTPASSDDSSSPLVPILLAIAVLAAISVGAVVLRQRRQRRSPGAQVSPKAS